MTLAWTLSNAYCAVPIVYTLDTDPTGGTVNSVFSITSSNGIEVSGATVSSYVGSYPMSVTATVGAYHTSSAILFSVTLIETPAGPTF